MVKHTQSVLEEVEAVEALASTVIDRDRFDRGAGKCKWPRTEMRDVLGRREKALETAGRARRRFSSNCAIWIYVQR